MEVDSTYPPWVTSFRPAQIAATEQIVERFNDGVDVVCLDAATGAGKTLISEMVRRGLHIARSSYVAHSLDLQDQFLRDFANYARVLKGRSNYPTLLRPDYSGLDCTGKACQWCDPRSDCPYICAKRDAITSEVAVLNISYMLAFQQPLFIRGFVTIDEADTLEKVMLGHYELHISQKRLAELGIDCPKKGVHEPTMLRWMEEELTPATLEAIEKAKAGDPDDVQTVRELNSLERLREGVELVLTQIPQGRPWVREYVYGKEGDFKLKPVEVSAQGGDMLWKRGIRSNGGERGAPNTKWLCMSGSFIDAGSWAESVGVEAAGLSWDLVTVPMEWDKRHRPIVYKPAGNMKKAEFEQSFPKVAEEIVRIRRVHGDDNIVVHAVSYQLMRNIVAWLRREGIETISYEGSNDRAMALQRFKDRGGVIVAPSLDRGVDLPGNMCTVQVVAKVPFPSLGDPQIRERMNLPGGGIWYAIQVARSLVQMSGRGVRYDGDRCVLYVLDAGFGDWWGKWSRLLPRYFKDAIVAGLPDDWMDGE